MSDRVGADEGGETVGQRQVLVVEDEPQIADLYRGCLEGAGYGVRTEHTVADGLDAVDAEFDVALLDRRLPDGEGTDVLAEIRERGLDIRVAMVTAVVPDFDIIEMGFDLYLLKPISQEDLLNVVQTLFTRSEYDEKLQQTASLVSKRAILEVGKEESELDESEEYDQLVERIDELNEELDDLTQEFTTEDYRTMFREIGRV